MLVPFGVFGAVTSDRLEEDFLDGSGNWAWVADFPIVDGTDRYHLSRSAGEESLVGGVEIAPEEVALLVVESQISSDDSHRVLGDALQRPSTSRRGGNGPVANHEQILPSAFGDLALWGQQDGLVVAGPDT